MRTLLKTRDINGHDRAWHMPTVNDGETVIFAEPGRVWDLKADGGSYDVCYRSHDFIVVNVGHNRYRARVSHGGGEETWTIHDSLVVAMHAMSSDQRYFTLYALLDAIHDAQKATRAKIEGQYRSAFVNGRLRKRKQRGANSYKVWIEPAPREAIA